MAEIVVGVDGSPGGEAALRWAVEEARLRHSRVHVVHAFEPEPPPLDVLPIGPPGSVADVLPGEREQLTRNAESAAGAVLEASLERAGVAGGDVAVRTSIVRGAPATALVDAARDAELLVVGSRRQGAVRDLLLGSVSHECARTSRCPVVVLPPAESSA